ncbi:MAG TPA: HPr family phosphocarrier protein, partial [Propionibacteriaceae bacterium]|nr:HPr family phosphocarrier protein [Propionibacteriaceae bacterium]
MTLGGASLTFTTTIRNPHGLHARPAATLVAGLRGLEADVLVSNLTLGKGPVSARSLTRVATLGLRKGDELVASFSGPDADLALARLRELAEDDFGESVTPPKAVLATTTPGTPTPTGTGLQIVVGRARVELTTVDASTYEPGSPTIERGRVSVAITEVLDHLVRLAVTAGNADIFEAQATILGDDELVGAIDADIDAGHPATVAVERQL